MLKLNYIENIQLTSQIFLKPEYKIHDTVSGNKFRKLKYNLERFKSGDFEGILTFGGAFSSNLASEEHEYLFSSPSSFSSSRCAR